MVLLVTLAMLLSGTPVAFGLGAIAVVFIMIFQGFGALHVVAETFYAGDVATGSICAGGTLGILIPPSITFILYGIATETSIGRLFLAGVMPGIMLTGLFMLWTLFIIWKRGFRSHAVDFRYSWKEKFQSIPKIAPFLAIIVGVMYLLVCGFFIPPAAIILMTAPILYPVITAAGFDPVWFGVILTINMEIGLIHPPVGLNIYIVSSIAPDVPVTRIMWGTIPYVACMFLAIVILCVFPEIATWLPDKLMGVARR